MRNNFNADLPPCTSSKGIKNEDNIYQENTNL